MLYLIRLSPEIIVKSSGVRRRWTKFLAQNIRGLARQIHPKIKVRQNWDGLVVVTPKTGEVSNHQIVELLSRVPGIAYFAQVHEHIYTCIDDITALVLPLWREKIKDKTFCVRVKRTGKHDFSSVDVEKQVGAALNSDSNSLGVKLKNPDVTVNIEIAGDGVSIVTQRYEGIGGFPVGTQENVLSLISGGFDSTVASFLMIKRGLRTHYCFFNLGGSEHELAVKEVAYYLWHRYGASHKTKFITVPFEPVVEAIVSQVSPSNMGVVLKRMMLRVASKIAERAHIQAIVTGESVAQVSSQTLPNLSLIDKVTDKLVLRPLIVSDKRDIIDLARKIGAEHFCAAIPEYCGVISVKPSAQVNLATLLDDEAKLAENLVNQAYELSTMQSIDRIIDDADIDENISNIPHVSILPRNACVIDIRHPFEVEANHFILDNEDILTIPFYSLNNAIDTLGADKHYYLYCEKGIMSGLHAAHLQQKGYKNIGVYKPKNRS